ncbi:MAG: NAD(P)H-hydrate dehydratase [Planctomycetes bacterium]|nr:NAD(P)H-hydrate dehydratase [Planctomycetota bacterium]
MNPLIPLLPARDRQSHKGDYGRVLLIGGSRGMSGAIGLAGIAALRSGAGLVRLAVPNSILEIVAGYEPSYMTVSLPDDDQGRIVAAAREQLQEQLSTATCVVCGPGLGRSRGVDTLVHWLYTTVTQPLVLDADALNALAEQPATLPRAAGPRILTPHPGEFRRLASGRFEDCPDEDRLQRLAAEWRVTVVLKGFPTRLSDGVRDAAAAVGNPGMATGGAGDVLTGVIAGLLGQGLSAWDAALLGVHVHGAAGDLAAEELGQAGMIASDLPRYLPGALRRYSEPNAREGE